MTTAPALDRDRFAHVDITTGRQAIDCQAVTEALFPYPVRFKVHHDTSYAEQSWARAEVWSEGSLCWNEIATYDSGMWAADSGSVHDRARQATDPTEGINHAMHVLESRVRRLLGTR